MFLKRLVVGTFAALLLGALVPTTSTAAGKHCWSYKGSERKFTKKINLARSRVGSRPIRLDPQLTKVARKHTREMTGAKTLFHTPSSKLGRRVTNWSWLGENVGVGGGVDSLHRAFMRSLGHKRNIQSRRVRHVGIGVRRSHGRMWVTVIFQSQADPGTTLPMPSC